MLRYTGWRVTFSQAGSTYKRWRIQAVSKRRSNRIKHTKKDQTNNNKQQQPETKHLLITTKHNMRILGISPFFQATEQQLHGGNLDAGHLSSIGSAVSIHKDTTHTRWGGVGSGGLKQCRNTKRREGIEAVSRCEDGK